MRRLSPLAAGIALYAGVVLTAAVAPAVARERADEAAVRAALEHYLAGHATGQRAHFEQAFHPQGRLYFVRDDTLATRTVQEYVAGAKGKPAPDEAQRRRRIASVDVEGDAAIARVELDYPDARFTDYMSLLRIGGEWRIVAKTFTVEWRGGER